MRKAAVQSNACYCKTDNPQEHVEFKNSEAQSIANPVQKAIKLFSLVPVSFDRGFPEVVWLFLNCHVLILISKFTFTLTLSQSFGYE